MPKFKNKAVWIILLLTLLFLPAIKDLLRPGYFPMHDDLQVFRLYELDKCLKDGQIPCRWIPDGGFGYGYPMFQFYPPLPYYPAEVFHLLGLSLFTSMEIMFILALLLSGYFMFSLASEFFGFYGGLLSAVFYVYAPYHSVDIYVRGALNEAWGMVWFPLILLYSYKLIKKVEIDKATFLGLSLSIAALLLSHNVMTLIFAPLALIWAFYWLIKKKSWPKLKPLITAGLLAVGLAAFFFIPVLLEQSAVHVESMTIGYFNYLAHFASLKQMFTSRFWGYGGSIWGPDDGMAFPLGHFHWILAGAVGLISLIKLKFKSSPKVKDISLLALILLAISLISIFLVHPRSVWFWDNLPFLYYAQFPWRLLTLPVFIFSFLIGGLFYLIKTPKKLKILLTSLLIIAVIGWNLPFFKIDYPVYLAEEEKLSGRLWELQVTGGIFDYLPQTASRPPGSAGFTIPQYINGYGGILDYKSGSNWLEFQAQVSSPSAQVMLPLFGYPGMQVKVDHKKTAFQTDHDLGRIIIDLPQGISQVSARLTKTPIRLIADLISLVSIFILLKLIFKHERNPTP